MPQISLCSMFSETQSEEQSLIVSMQTLLVHPHTCRMRVLSKRTAGNGEEMFSEDSSPYLSHLIATVVTFLRAYLSSLLDCDFLQSSRILESTRQSRVRLIDVCSTLEVSVVRCPDLV